MKEQAKYLEHVWMAFFERETGTTRLQNEATTLRYSFGSVFNLFLNE